MEIREILEKNKFRFKKALGQNFITDTALLNAIVKDAQITAEDTVLEIGTGAGTLTRALSQVAKKVITFDVDHDLQDILSQTLAGLDNVEMVFADVLKLSDDDILTLMKQPFKVVANLPYYITTPLIMRMVESKLPLISMTIMVQKEVADRLSASPNTPDYGAITLGIGMYAHVSVVRTVNRRVFYPIPKVDSAIVHIIMDDNKYVISDKKLLSRLIKAGFAMRRKTLVNNMVSSFNLSKDTAKEILLSLGFSENLRGETLSITDYISISDKLKTYL